MDISLVRHDLQPFYYTRATETTEAAAAAGRVEPTQPINLSGATILATMLDRQGKPVFRRRATGVVVTNAAQGEFELRWQPGDTDLLGNFDLEFEITPASGGKFTIPRPGQRIQVKITPDLDNE